ncbi:MAG: C_GCAxxG_C_C family protein [Dehalococcoidales bacterium]|nr:MAG: C_GCAxxG_C_C family protein [Dehalococcoidales bacterium]
MHKAYGLDDDAMLWAGTTFFGGISGHQDGVCGAVFGVGIALSFRHRDTSGDKEKEQQARELAIRKTGEIVKEFKARFGTIVCIDLVGVDFSDPEAARRHFENPPCGITDTCPDFVRFVVEKMIETEDQPEE